MVTLLEELFPGLAGANYRITSPQQGRYNCVAWAAGDSSRWWWPGPDLVNEYWPPGVEREETIAAFQKVFSELGYTSCESADAEAGFEKVALFGDSQNQPKHAARQLPSGTWTSKLGKLEDIEHELGHLEGLSYGTVLAVMRRPLQ
jgi:hypothetical protein